MLFLLLIVYLLWQKELTGLRETEHLREEKYCTCLRAHHHRYILGGIELLLSRLAQLLHSSITGSQFSILLATLLLTQ